MKKFASILFNSIENLSITCSKHKKTDDTVQTTEDYLNQFMECVCQNSNARMDELNKYKNNIKNKKTDKYRILMSILILFVIILSIFALISNTKFLTTFSIIATTLALIAIFYLIDYTHFLDELNKFLTMLKYIGNPDNLYERLGTNTLMLLVNKNLVPIADPDQGSNILPLLAALRYRFTDNYGYIFPLVRICDDSILKDNTYTWCVRDFSAGIGVAYPDKILVNFKDIKSETCKIEKIKFEGNFLEDSNNWYWINEADANNFEKEKKLKPVEVIIKHLEKILIDYVQYIFSYTNVLNLESLVKSEYENQYCTNKNDKIITYDRNLWWYIFVNLLKDRISIKDVCFIAEKITFYSAITDNWDEILNNIKNDIKNLKPQSDSNHC